MGMCGKCSMISGVLVLVAGLALLASGLGSLGTMLAHEVAGVTLGLTGLGMAVGHKLCPDCKKC